MTVEKLARLLDRYDPDCEVEVCVELPELEYYGYGRVEIPSEDLAERLPDPDEAEEWRLSLSLFVSLGVCADSELRSLCSYFRDVGRRLDDLEEQLRGARARKAVIEGRSDTVD